MEADLEIHSKSGAFWAHFIRRSMGRCGNHIINREWSGHLLWQFRRIKLAAINVLEDGLGLCALPGSCDDLRGFDNFGF